MRQAEEKPHSPKPEVQKRITTEQLSLILDWLLKQTPLTVLLIVSHIFWYLHFSKQAEKYELQAEKYELKISNLEIKVKDLQDHLYLQRLGE